MRQSKLFTKTRKEAPSDEVAKNAQLLVRAGYIHKEMAGVYDFLPLGLRVVENIQRIVREEMNRVGGQELIMSSLQRKDLWERTERWNDDVVDVWFKSGLKAGGEVGFGWSHEEPIMDMMHQHVASYKDLPASVYQFQTKLRNEVRAKSGIMRGREFVMKDMYSLHASQEDLDAYYEQVKQAYLVIFNRLGLGEDTYVTFASGGAFTKFSHEFQTVCDAGEDVLYVHKGLNIGVNEEVLEDAVRDLGINKDELEKVKSAEVGNIFNFGTAKAEHMGLTFKNQEGTKQPTYLASYGIGITRAMGVIVEKFSDEKGLVWPESVAPFAVHLVSMGKEGDEIATLADEVYAELTAKGVEVLYDDRDARAGEKFADSDLIGIPKRIVVGKDALATGTFEVVERKTGEVTKLSREQLG